MATLRRAFDWTFRDRRDGRVTVAQWPNLPLWGFLAFGALHRLAGPSSPIGLVTRAAAVGCLGWWAIDEVVRGVNPWRRILGGAVLAALAFQLLGAEAMR